MLRLNQAQQEGREALLRAGLAEEHQHRLLVRELLAHEAQELALEAGDLAGDLLDPVEGEHADAGGLENAGGADVLLALDGVEPHQLPRQVEADDLLGAVVTGGVALDRAGADRVDGVEPVTGPEQVLASAQRPGPLHQGVEPVHVRGLEPHGHAQLRQTAIAAGDSDRSDIQEFVA